MNRFDELAAGIRRAAVGDRPIDESLLDVVRLTEQYLATLRLQRIVKATISPGATLAWSSRAGRWRLVRATSLEVAEITDLTIAGLRELFTSGALLHLLARAREEHRGPAC